MVGQKKEQLNQLQRAQEGFSQVIIFELNPECCTSTGMNWLKGKRKNLLRSRCSNYKEIAALRNLVISVSLAEIHAARTSLPGDWK